MTDKQKNIIKIAKSLIGAPYKYGAIIEEAPDYFDCSGFIQYVFKQTGVDLPRSSILQASEGKEIKSIDDLEAGDILFMRSDRGHYYDKLFNGRKIYIGHCVLYIGAGEIIHSRKAAGGVIKQRLEELVKEPNYEIILIKRIL
ncbi:MAG: NLP/P60 protein [Candidatus Wolfebacteria bacterium GW2011_GWA2_42_10]|uniref:NLP/P60 protein n=2 Tax=Candidatus Wolfeibacteriota TaxID=1752735 RepID=A0A0G0XLC1_9BACT|nr:MAG: NLP/P60 protein [Candidatus Wolfebacteria bacterium GW2011_GWB1_41_12]KKS25685.1 MAG: NLP/P60 protein [Candidatus Wolfebacteria bacterium GW2011_GWA2_42_10]KKT56382.1 MAG: NLP/P60 protein [Candidatus Wolfebacteria bacterium GW2011_GWA1_44_24]